MTAQKKDVPQPIDESKLPRCPWCAYMSRNMTCGNKRSGLHRMPVFPHGICDQYTSLMGMRRAFFDKTMVTAIVPRYEK